MVNKILAYYPRYDKQTLLNYSLLAKSWGYQSQNLHDWHLYICFTPKTYRTRWETASPASMEGFESPVPATRSRHYHNP